MAPISTIFTFAAAAAAATLPKPAWTLTPTGSPQRFRGLAPVSATTAWVAGTNSTILRTNDAGATWLSVFRPPPDNSTEETSAPLEFRDIAAWSSTHAVALSIGEGPASRIYATADGGATWRLAFSNADPAAFYDCLAFSETDPAHGLAVSDPVVDGRFRLLETRDQGLTWHLLPSEQTGMPPAREGESGFAASGTCLETKAGRWYLASGGAAPRGRVFASADDGRTWDSVMTETPIPAANASQGVFSVRFRDAAHGLVVGGDFQDPTRSGGTAGWSDDGGVTWHAAEQFPGGYRSGAAWVSGLCPSKGEAALAVGPTGSDFTLDGGRTWHGFDDGSFDAVECVGDRVCWASGEKGRVARLVF
ncbi:hypothetical protein PG985_016407 [Apiospora marii]|uniref:uncharacterized protein n=1 Tax=Apiospora marii TaxID=335849 RepID=UPI00312D6684